MLARFYPTASFVEVVVVLASVMASSLRQRRVRAHLGVRRLALASALLLELAPSFPTRVRVVAQACSLLLSCLVVQDFAVGYQGRFRHGIRQAPECGRRSLRLLFACMPGTPIFVGRCGAPGTRPRSWCEMDRHGLDGLCRQCRLQLRSERLLLTSETP